MSADSFAAIAASKNTAARGNVICETAKKEDRRCGARAAHKESRYSPNDATPPLNMQVRAPGIIPADAIASGKVSMPEAYLSEA